MNTRTTLFLAGLFALVAVVYFFIRSSPQQEQIDTTPMSMGTSPMTRDLLEDKPGDIVKVVCQRKNDEPWEFEKEPAGTEGGQPVWRMTSPRQMQCVRWEVDKFGNTLGRLQYELSYKPGEPGAVTAADAGLDPPETTVTLINADGKTAKIEIGKPAGRRETYVRLAGSDEIVVAKDDLSSLVKDKPLDYRDKQLFDFAAGSATRVEITDRSNPAEPVTYVFNRDGDRWMMASPVTARSTGKVDEMLTAMGRLRAIQWQDDDAGALAAYGLEPAVLTVRTTVEEKIPVIKEEIEGEEPATPEEPEADAEETPQFETRIKTYELHLSDQSPLGEETKTYMRVGDETDIATVNRTMAETFKPVMSEWREMRITMVDVGDATGVKLITPAGSTSLFKRDGAWFFDPDGGRAEDSAVSTLLRAIGDLTAVAFIDDPPDDLASFGLVQPRGEIQLAIPGVEGAERIAVGGHTDEQTKRLVYVRRNDLTSIAKVRTPDVSALLSGPEVYRDRTIVDVLPSRFERISLSARRPGFGELAPAETVTLKRDGTDWSMIEPVEAGVRTDQMDKLVEALGGLRAEQVVEENAEPTAYGMNEPQVTVTLVYRASEVSAPSSEGDGPEPAGKRPPTEQSLELRVTEHDGKHYAMRADRGTVYQVSGDFLRQLQAEVRTDRVLDFPDGQVSSFSIRKGDRTDVFERRDDRWVYPAEPDLPLDEAKVDNLLLQLHDLRTDRFVHHSVADLAAYGLSEPSHEVTVTVKDGAQHVLRVSSLRGGSGTEEGHYAAVDGRSGVFVLTDGSLQRFDVVLEELEVAP